MAENVETKVQLKINDDAENKEYTFSIPQTCSYGEAKHSVLSVYDYLVRLEYDAVKAKQEAEATKPTETPDVVIEKD